MTFMLSVGDPVSTPRPPSTWAAIDSLLAGNTHYADVRGKRTLRDAIARQQQARSGQAVTSKQVIVLAGAQCALFSVAQCVLNPGDEVLVAEPMYVTYEAVFGACGAVVIPVLVRSENGFRVMPEDVAARITRAPGPGAQPAQPVEGQPAEVPGKPWPNCTSTATCLA